MINTNFSTHSNDSINYLINTNNLLIDDKNLLNYTNNLNKKIFSTITLSLSELNIIKSSKEFHAFFKIGSPLFLGHLGFICILNL